MTNSILQLFLDNRFIKTDDSEHLANLSKASDEVQKLLRKNKPKILTYTLVALDPTIADDEPIVKEVETLIIKQWPTFRNSVAKTKDTPIAYIQAVILEALIKLSNDENFAAIIWHTGCNIISYYKLEGQKEVLTHFMLEIGKKAEEAGRNKWSVLENAQIDTIDPIELSLPSISEGLVDEAKLQVHLKAAAGQVNTGGENPQWPSNNSAIWPDNFSTRAAKGLAEEINAAVSAQNKSLTSSSDFIQKSIGSYLAKLKPYMEQVSSSILQSSQSLNKRSDLLWWKQALYSARLDTSYRTLAPLTLAVTMAVDLADNVAPIYPKSVDFFLKETLRDVLGHETDKELSVAELLKQLLKFSVSERRILDNLLNSFCCGKILITKKA
jgi:hypothetical protein